MTPASGHTISSAQHTVIVMSRVVSVLTRSTRARSQLHLAWTLSTAEQTFRRSGHLRHSVRARNSAWHNREFHNSPDTPDSTTALHATTTDSNSNSNSPSLFRLTDLSEFPEPTPAAHFRDTLTKLARRRELHVAVAQFAAQPWGTLSRLALWRWRWLLGLCSRQDDSELTEQARGLLFSSSPPGREVETHNTALHAYRYSRTRCEDTERAIQEMRDVGVEPNASTYRMLVKAYAETGDIDACEDTLREMVEERGLQPDVGVYNALLSAYAGSGDSEGAEAILKTIQESGLQPDVYTFSVLLGAYATARDIEGALDVINRMRKANLTPNAVTYNSFLAGHSKLEDAARVFSILFEMKVPLNLRSYTTLLRGYARRGDLDGALSVMKGIRDANLEPDLVTYNTLLWVFVPLKDINGAQKVLEQISESGLVPDAVTYNIILSVLAESNTPVPDLVNDVWEQFKASGLRPSPYTLAHLLKCFANPPNPVRAEEIFREFVRRYPSVEPSVHVFYSLVSAVGPMRAERMFDAQGFDYSQARMYKFQN